jgi:DNA-binding NarL/FixJ family response regulator
MKTTDTRSRFQKVYGSETYRVISLLAQGYSTVSVARKLRMRLSRVRAYAANLTRGTYDRYLAGCGWKPRFTTEAHTVVGMIRSGATTDTITTATGLSTESIAAYRANETRGTYADMV